MLVPNLRDIGYSGYPLLKYWAIAIKNGTISLGIISHTLPAEPYSINPISSQLLKYLEEFWTCDVELYPMLKA